MNPQPDWNFAIVTASGLTQKEFAALSKVSRITAIHWLQGRRCPSRHVAPRVATILKRLEQATNDGLLPPKTPKTSPRSGPEQARQRTLEIIHALRR